MGLDSSEVGHPTGSVRGGRTARFAQGGPRAGRRPPEYIRQALTDWGGTDRPRRHVRGGPWASTEARGGTGTAYRLPALQREAARLSRSRGAPRKADAGRGVVRDGELRLFVGPGESAHFPVLDMVHKITADRSCGSLTVEE